MIEKHPKAENIIEETDYSHSIICSEIINMSEFLGYAFGRKATYKLNIQNGYILIRLYKDKTDDKFYDYCEYQIVNSGDYMKSITFTMSNIEDFWNLYNNLLKKELRYEVVSFRKYGQPKLNKPKELKGIKASGSITFIPKKCNPQYFIKGDDIWIKHTDYFSPSYYKPEDVGTPLSYRLKKYGISEKYSGDKFIYSDCWGDIVLRNEAWIKIINLIPYIKTHNNIQTSNQIVSLMEKYHGWENMSIDSEWNRFYEDLCVNLPTT